MDIEGAKVHFMGIGGIGMSALAMSALYKGAAVSGCDLVERPSLVSLRRAGIEVHIGHDPAHVRDADILVYTRAVPRSHPEVTAAEEAGVEILSRERLLARFMRGAFSIGVTGAHGKTTTTWLTARILLEAGKDPTVFVGGVVEEIGGNFRKGSGDLFVAEVDESNGIVEEFSPSVAVITNVDDEHLDRFSGRGAMARAVRNFAARCSGGGPAVVWTGEMGLPEMAARPPEGVRVVGVSDRPGSDYLLDVSSTPPRLVGPDGRSVSLPLPLPGRHNLINAALAAACALECGVSAESIRNALASATPVGRRQSFIGAASRVKVFDDYAHHPTEIRATVEALRPLVEGRLIGVFQPHRYTRTAALMERFADALSLLDKVILLDIYPAGEEPLKGADSASLARLLAAEGRDVQYIRSRRLAAEHAAASARPGDCIVTMGAGDVGELAPRILGLLGERDRGR